MGVMIEKASVAAAIVQMTRRMKSSLIKLLKRSLPRGRTRTLRPSGTQQWKQLSWHNSIGFDPTYPAPHAQEQRSATERKCSRGRCALRCVSKHEGATQSLILIFRDARTLVRVCG